MIILGLFNHDVKGAKMKKYHHLTREERYQIYALRQEKHTQIEIARNLCVSKSTISRELRRNKGERGYRPKQADEKAVKRRREARKTKRITQDTWKEVEEKIELGWSPEQISGRRKMEELVISGYTNIFIGIKK